MRPPASSQAPTDHQPDGYSPLKYRISREDDAALNSVALEIIEQRVSEELWAKGVEP